MDAPTNDVSYPPKRLSLPAYCDSDKCRIALPITRILAIDLIALHLQEQVLLVISLSEIVKV